MEQDSIPHQVEKLLQAAITQNASDIYFLPYEESCLCRFKVNGIQKDVLTLGREAGLQCITRVKVLAGLLTYVTKSAQDGSFEFENSSFRCASIPTIHGERLTLRVLNSGNNLLYLDDLGYSDSSLSAMKDIVRSKQGLILLTGATGSGKTTSIYALLRELLEAEQDHSSVISLEDPVEQKMDGISQVEITEDWGYAEALKASLRQDVKTLLIGELRDQEVVRVALDAALSGHRIISTYHAGDIVSIFSRLLHTGFEPFLIAGAISGCISLSLEYDNNNNCYRPLAKCFKVDDSWRDLILRKPGMEELRKAIEKRVVS